MTIASYTRRQDRDRPYRSEAEQRNAERMERQATMPKDLAGLLRWFDEELRLEVPDALHTGQVWRDRVAPHEDVQPVGASDTGALAYNDDFRRILENGPSEVDGHDAGTDGRVYYLRPVSAALSRLHRNGRPLTARLLINIARRGFEWRSIADDAGIAHELFTYMAKEALVLLWKEHRDWARSN